MLPVFLTTVLAPRRSTGAAAFTPAALFASGEAGAWYDTSDLSYLFQDTSGTIPVTAVDDPVSLVIDRAKGATPSTMWRGLDITPDYWVDATAGSDSNAGTSEGAAWATLSKIDETIVSAGQTKRVLVKAGTYSTANDYILINDAPSGSRIEISFQPGCVMDGSTASASANTSGIEADSSGSTTYAVVVYGNGLTVQHYNYTTGGASPQGIGCSGGATLSVYDVTVDDTVDGVSGHTGCHINLYDVTVKNSVKQIIANISSSTMDAHRCSFEGSGVESANFATDSNAGGLNRFYDCVFLPGANPSKNFSMDNIEMYRCQFGTPTQSINVVNKAGGPTKNYFESCFVNARIQLFKGFEFVTCYGLLSGRVRNTSGTFSMSNCVIVGPASGLANIFFSNVNDGASCKLSIKNNIFQSATAAAFMSVDATNAGYVVAAGSEFFNNVLYGGAAYDADLVTADGGNTVIVGTVTADPVIGAANTTDPDDYGYGAGSSAIGAGTSGTNIGFAAGAIEGMTAQQVRGPNGLPGAHATLADNVVLAQSGDYYYLNQDGVDDLLTSANADLGTDATVAFSNVGTGASISQNQTVGANYTTAADFHQLVLLDRALTAEEEADLTAFLNEKAGYVPSTWTPATLFASGELGYWIDPSDFSTMFQDSAGTTPVTAVGQEVGKILDKSGNNIHLTQATATRLPILQQDAGGNYYLDFDGSNDYLATAAINASAQNSATVCCGITKDSDAEAGTIVEVSANYSTTDGTFVAYYPQGAVYEVGLGWNGTGAINVGRLDSAGLAAPITSVWTGLVDLAGAARTDVCKIRINGTEQTLAFTSAELGGGTFSATSPHYIGARFNAGAGTRLNGRIYGLVVRFATTAGDDLTSLESYMAAKSGVTLA